MAGLDMKTAVALLALSLVSAPAAAQSTPPVKDRNGCEVHNGWPDFNCLDALAAKRAPAEAETLPPMKVLPPGTIAAAAKRPPPTKLVPPPEYDHPYTGYLEIVVGQTEEEMLDKLCNRRANPFHPLVGPIGCSEKLVNEKDPTLTGCRIYIASDEIIKKRGFPPDLILRHEMGHCNGWPGDHPGALPYGEGAD